jgi:hypothetical protein
MPKPSRLELLLLGIALAVDLNSFYKMRELLFRLFLTGSLDRLFRREKEEMDSVKYSYR